MKGTKMLVVAITRIDAETDEKEFKKNYEIDIDHGIGDAKVSFK